MPRYRLFVKQFIEVIGIFINGGDDCRILRRAAIQLLTAAQYNKAPFKAIRLLCQRPLWLRHCAAVYAPWLAIAHAIWRGDTQTLTAQFS
ncbi:hypothetical protein [Alteromonas gilva]|uniref:Uncharacterized protein n=1 Tax=Alteromonas gilva TaxID=2987522 RepID=A0ABT5L6N6_9ALTE|nr:hypothetical protein [Alteromonas gilva]MDC8832728.1 hypothetical protein [Alteromonas gilva]